MADTLPTAPKRRLAKRTNRGRRATAVTFETAPSVDVAGPTTQQEVSEATTASLAPLVAPLIDSAVGVPADDAMEIIVPESVSTLPAPTATNSEPESDVDASRDEPQPSTGDAAIADTTVPAMLAVEPMFSNDNDNEIAGYFAEPTGGAPVGGQDEEHPSVDAFFVVFHEPFPCAGRKRPRSQEEPDDADSTTPAEHSEGPAKRTRIETDDTNVDDGAESGTSKGGADDSMALVDDRVQLGSNDDNDKGDVANGDEPCVGHEPMTNAIDNNAETKRQDKIDDNVYDRGDADKEEEEAMRIYEASLSRIDCYGEASKRNGIKRLYVLIEYLTALVGGGHCVSFDIGPDAPSLKRISFGAVTKRRTDSARRVEWTVRGGSAQDAQGAVRQPFGVVVDSLVAAPDVLHALHADWSPALDGHRASRSCDRIVLRLALTHKADRRGACRALAWLLDDDCLTEADAQAALPPARCRVSVHLDALWRRYLMHDHVIKAAAAEAARYRSALTAPSVCRADGAVCVTPAAIAAC